MKTVLTKYAVVFEGSVGWTKLIEHGVQVIIPAPMTLCPYSYSPEKQGHIDDTVRETEDQGLVKASTSQWVSPVILAKKKDESFRLREDYRRLNEVTVSDAQLMGNLHDMVRNMMGKRIFSTFDL